MNSQTDRGIAINPNVGSSTDAQIRIGNASNSYLYLYGDGEIRAYNNIIKFGTSYPTYSSILRFVKDPENVYDAANKNYVDTAVSDKVQYTAQTLTDEQKIQARTNISAAAISNVVSATLSASSWSSDSAPYTYTLSVTGVTANSNQEFLPALDITERQLTALQAANIQDGGQASGSVTLKAFGTKPTIDVPIRVIVRGDA